MVIIKRVIRLVNVIVEINYGLLYMLIKKVVLGIGIILNEVVIVFDYLGVS